MTQINKTKEKIIITDEEFAKRFFKCLKNSIDWMVSTKVTIELKNKNDETVVIDTGDKKKSHRWFPLSTGDYVYLVNLDYIQYGEGYHGHSYKSTHSMSVDFYSIEPSQYNKMHYNWSFMISKKCKKRIMKHIQYVEKELNFRSVYCFFRGLIRYFNVSFNIVDSKRSISTYKLVNFKLYKTPEEMVDQKIKYLFNYLKI